MAATYPRKIIALTSAMTRIFARTKLEERPAIVNSNGILVGRMALPNRYDNKVPRTRPMAAAITNVYVFEKGFLGINLLLYFIKRLEQT